MTPLQHCIRQIPVPIADRLAAASTRVAPGGGEREKEDVPKRKLQCACQTGPHSFAYFFLFIVFVIEIK
jgi:hypothetical protein